MNKNHSLEEDIRHGTKERPISVMNFTTGPGTLYPEYFYVQRHWHYESEILLIQKGSFHLERNLENCQLEEGDICMINSGELHMLEGIEQNSCHDAVIFNPQIFHFSYEDDMQKTLITPFLDHAVDLPQIIHPQEEGYECVRELLEEILRYHKNEPERWYFSVKLRLLELLFLLKEQQRLTTCSGLQNASEKEKIDRYKRVVSYIEQNYPKKVTLDHLAGAAQCNSHYLCRFFKDIAGISPVQYLIEQRVKAACEMLRDTTKSVLEISLDCGFENVSYFIRQFKRLQGKTPRQYRSQNWKMHLDMQQPVIEKQK